METTEQVQTESTAQTEPAQPTFKVVNSGTHETLGAEQPNNTPDDDDSNAEPANTATSQTANTNTPPAEGSTAEPATQTAAKLGSTPQSTQTEPAATTTPAAAPPPTMEEVLKAHGFDEQFINMAKVYKQEGNLNRYVQAVSTDFTKMTDEAIMRMDLQREYPTATQDDLDSLFEEVRDKYKLDEEKYDPESKEAKAARTRLKFDADKLRGKFTTENESYKLPSRDYAAEATQQATQAAAARQANVDALLGDPMSKAILTDKKLVLNELSIKDDAGKVVATIPKFTMELGDPDLIKNFLTDDGTTARKVLFGSDGKYNAEAAWHMGAFATNREQYCLNLINYGKMLGKEEYQQKGYNPPKQAGTAASPSNETLAEAFANRGRQGTHG